MPLPNRLAIYLTVFAGIAGAITPILANFDTASVVGWVGGMGLIAAAVVPFLLNWGKYEERTDLLQLGENDDGDSRDVPPQGL